MARLDDPDRLDALNRSGLLERDTRARLRSLCYTATQLLRADASMLNLLDDEVQIAAAWWPEDAGVLERQPLSESGCREVVAAERPIVVPDTAEHPIMCTLPWSMRWRGYLGAPIDYDGKVLGSLCVLTRAPRVWQAHDELTLIGLARLTGLVYD